jgi:endonuclease/exonuclease/phosphatase family metal-dependent hydrolase
MILLTWNVAFGRGTSKALEIADQLAVDVVFLQEAFTIPRWHGQVCCCRVDQRDWGSAVLVRHGTLEPIAISGYPGWVVGARWTPEQADVPPTLYLFSVHSPTANPDAPRESYVSEALKIVRSICVDVPKGCPLIIGGDFNFKSFGERLLDEQLASDRAELEALQEFRALGLFVAWRDAHPNAPLPQTLRWNGQPATPYHCDGFLVRGIDVTTLQCEVLGASSCIRESDHNPVVSWIRHSQP